MNKIIIDNIIHFSIWNKIVINSIIHLGNKIFNMKFKINDLKIFSIL